jgi:hypothetical protein
MPKTGLEHMVSPTLLRAIFFLKHPQAKTVLEPQPEGCATRLQNHILKVSFSAVVEACATSGAGTPPEMPRRFCYAFLRNIRGVIYKAGAASPVLA